MAFTITRRQVENQYYDEPVAEGILPLRMMLVPAGRFMMGSPETELDRKAWEGPQHEVTVSQFFMAKYSVTQAQWRAVATMPPVNRELRSEPSHFKGDLRPIEQVSWHDAVEFCDRLTAVTNRQYRLPTEAEWEYACRAGTNAPFHFGKTLSTNFSNYNDVKEENTTYGFRQFGNAHETTTPVDQLRGENFYGLCNMHGNVWEWCQDYWHDDYNHAPADASAWLTIREDSGSSRILRGGSWRSHLMFCRSACRSNNSSTFWSEEIGFRVACSRALNGTSSEIFQNFQALSKHQQLLDSIGTDLRSCQEASVWLTRNIDKLAYFASEVVSEKNIFSELKQSEKSLSEESLKARFSSDVASYFTWILLYMREGALPKRMDKASLYSDFKKDVYDVAFSKITEDVVDPIISQLPVDAANMLASYINRFIIDEEV